MSDSQPDIRKSARVWILPTVLLCCAFGFIAWLATPEDDPIIEPKPEMFHFTVSDEVRSKLPAKVRSFLEQLEARKVSGRPEAEFTEALSEFSDVEENRRSRRYFFRLDDYTGHDLESHPVIFVQVQKRTGKIVFCGVVIPCS